MPTPAKKLATHLDAPLLAALLGAFTLSFPAVVHADPGAKGTLAIGVERVFGLVSTQTDLDGADFSTTRFSLLWAGPQVVSPYSRPRVGVDYFIIDQLSIGGGLGFYTWSQEDADDNDVDGSGFLFSPRVGYMIGINNRLSFWPRGGFTFTSDTVDAAAETQDTASALSVEAPLLISIAPGLAINVGLTLDLGLGGEREVEGVGNVSVDEEHNEFGIQVGMVGFL
jgi:hypothetical protein